LRRLDNLLSAAISLAHWVTPCIAHRWSAASPGTVAPMLLVAGGGYSIEFGTTSEVRHGQFCYRYGRCRAHATALSLSSEMTLADRPPCNRPPSASRRAATACLELPQEQPE